MSPRKGSPAPPARVSPQEARAAGIVKLLALIGPKDHPQDQETMDSWSRGTIRYYRKLLGEILPRLDKASRGRILTLARSLSVEVAYTPPR